MNTRKTPFAFIELSEDQLQYWHVLEPKVKLGKRIRPRVRSRNRGTPKPRKPIRVHHVLIV